MATLRELYGPGVEKVSVSTQPMSFLQKGWWLLVPASLAALAPANTLSSRSTSASS